MGMFKKGYKAVDEEKKRQEENRAKLGANLWRFFLQNDGDEAGVRFLTEVPVTYYEHTLKTMSNGKERYDSVPCSGEDNCPYCANGDKPTFKGAYLIEDRRPYEYTDENGKKKKASSSIKLYVQGAKILSQLKRISNKRGLSNREVTIVRLGKGTQTTYTVEVGEEEDFPTKTELTNLLPEKLREYFDGTEDSLYHIIEVCLTNQMETTSSTPNGRRDFEDEDEEEEYNSSKNLVGADYDEDDEEDYTPRRKSSVKKSSLSGKKKMFKNGKRPVENSVKKIVKNKRK